MKLLRTIRELILIAVFTLVAVEVVFFLWMLFRIIQGGL